MNNLKLRKNQSSVFRLLQMLKFTVGMKMKQKLNVNYPETVTELDEQDDFEPIPFI